MGIRNYLIEGVSGTGKTSVCHALQQRGYHAVNTDQALAYKGDPETGTPLKMPGFKTEIDRIKWGHEHHIWNVETLKSMIADTKEELTFFCGGARNFKQFIELFDDVFVLDADWQTLARRLEKRPVDEFGGRQIERDLIAELNATKRDVPACGLLVDATQPLARVVSEILAKVTGQEKSPSGPKG